MIGARTTDSDRLLLVEDDRRVADCIRDLLITAGHRDVWVVASCREAAELFRAARPQLVLLDLGLPDGDGVEFLRDLRAHAFRGSVLVLTSATSPDRILTALQAGADGYLFKDDIDVRLLEALRELTGGGAPLSSRAARVVLDSLREGAPGRVAELPQLSKQELRVLEELSTGASYIEIGGALHISLNTVRTYIRSVYEKLGVENRAEAINLGWQTGLLRRAV